MKKIRSNNSSRSLRSNNSGKIENEEIETLRKKMEEDYARNAKAGKRMRRTPE